MDWAPFAFAGGEVYVAPDGAGDGKSADAPLGDLQAAIDAAPDGATIVLAPGEYAAAASDYVDEACGNCAADDPKKPVATTGFVVRGKSIAIRGAGRDETKLVTGAGYGVLVEDACEVRIEGLTITGGKRDLDGDAADAALVARRSRIALVEAAIAKNKELLPNKGYPGIAGILCREDSDVLVLRSELVDNSWDGVAVYRGGHVRVVASKIDKGNGVGVGVTWNGRAKIVASEISRYWKGVGSFQDAKAEVYATLIHEQKGWGLAAADRGELVAVNNTIVHNDQLALLISAAGASGRLVNNVVAFNGANATGAFKPETFGRGGIRGASAVVSAFEIAHNVLFENQGGDWITADAKREVPEADWGETTRAVDPKLVSRTEPTPAADSPLLHSGDPSIENADGSRSHIGATGGPHAGATDP